VSDDDQLGLALLNELGDMVETILDEQRLLRSITLERKSTIGPANFAADATNLLTLDVRLGRRFHAHSLVLRRLRPVAGQQAEHVGCCAKHEMEPLPTSQC